MTGSVLPVSHNSVEHALSVDVEDWYHDGGITPPSGQDRVETNTLRLLDLFAAHQARATFFFLGEVVERYPHLVRRAVEAGHEVGSHGYCHRRVDHLLRDEFRSDVARSLRLIEDVSGVRVYGYRAPYFSIKADVHWPVNVLHDLGLVYDSSILAIDRPPGMELVCPRNPYRHANGLWEVPVAILRLLAWNLPLAGGNGLRWMPPALLRRMVRRFEQEIGPGVFYLHPWELDPASPTGPGLNRFFLRVGREKLPARLDELLREKRFAPIREVFAETLLVPAAAA